LTEINRSAAKGNNPLHGFDRSPAALASSLAAMRRSGRNGSATTPAFLVSPRHRVSCLIGRAKA
jgi:hypothetical protein